MATRRSILMAAIATCALNLSPAFAMSPRPFDADAFADAQKSGRPILVAVYAPWCPTCRAQAPILSELTAEPKFARLAYFTVDYDHQKKLVRRFGAQMQSTLIVFKDGKEQGRSVGATDRASIAALLNKSL